MTDVFISYAREDRPFVQRLHDALANEGRDSWVDWEGIPASAKWMVEVRAAIDASECFCFVVSPDSVESPVCREEASHAAASNKRILPLVHRDVPDGLVPETVAVHNWIRFTDQDEFDEAFGELVRALQTEPEHLSSHTRLLVRAKEWESRRNDRSFLLRGRDLEEAEEWLSSAQGKEPAPTQLHTTYVLASRKAASRRQRGIVGAVAAALVVSIVLASVAVIQRGTAQREREEAVEQRDLARSSALASASLSELDRDPELGLLLALEAAAIRRTPQVEDSLREALKTSNVEYVYEGHEAEVSDLAFAPDGSWLASSSNDGTIQIWNPATGEQRTLIDYRGFQVYALAASPDGQRLASVGHGVDFTIWDSESGEQVLVIPLPSDALVYTLSFSPDGKQILAAGSPEGEQILAAGDPGNGGVLIWDAISGQPLDSINVPGGAKGASFSPDGELIVSAGGDGVIRLWDVRTGAEVGEFVGHQEAASAVWFSPDASRLVSVGEDRTVRVWDVRSGEEIALLLHVSPVNDAVFVRGRDYVATVDAEGVGRIWSLDTGEPVSDFVGHESSISSVAYDAARDLVATGSSDGTVRVWRPGTGVSELDVERPIHISGARYSADGALITLPGVSEEGGFPDLVEILDAKTGRSLRTLRVPDDTPEFQAQVGTPWFTPDGGMVAATVVDENDRKQNVSMVQFWNSQTGDSERAYTLPSHRYPYAIGFSADGTRFALTAGDWVTRVVETDSSEVEAQFEGKGSDRSSEIIGGLTAVFVASFDPRDRYVATPSGNSAVLWDPETDEVIRRFEGHGGSVTGLDFSPDGRMLVTASDDQTARIWDVATGEQIALLAGHQSYVVSAEFSPDGRFVVTAAHDGIVRIWDIDGKELQRYRASELVANSATFSPDGSSVLVATGDGVRITPLGIEFESNVSGKVRVFACEICAGFDELIALAGSRVTRELTPEERAIYLGG